MAPMRHSGEQPAAVGIVAALAAEARPLGPAARRRGELAALADGTLVAVTGIGGASAARGARTLVEEGCGALASWGLAGGLDPALACGAILLPEEVTLDGGSSLRTAPAWRERIVRSLEAHRPVRQDRLLTSVRALGTVADKSAAFRITGASAVDMESFAVAEVAAAHGLPFVAVRVIVDTAGDELPAALVGAADASGQLSIARLLRSMVLRPASIATLLRLARRYGAARGSLRAIVRAGALVSYAP